MLNEKSDIYSFGVVLLESVTARDPVDYSKPADEVEAFPIFRQFEWPVYHLVLKSFFYVISDKSGRMA